MTGTLGVRCKKSKDCPGKEVCDTKQHTCRDPLTRGRKPQGNKAALARVCLEKAIPIHYEQGPRKGQRKDRAAMRHCKDQAARNHVTGGPRKALPAPSAHRSPSPVAHRSPSPVAHRSPTPPPASSPLNEAKLMAMDYKDQLLPLHKRLEQAGKITVSKATKFRKDLVVGRILRAL